MLIALSVGEIGAIIAAIGSLLAGVFAGLNKMHKESLVTLASIATSNRELAGQLEETNSRKPDRGEVAKMIQLQAPYNLDRRFILETLKSNGSQIGELTACTQRLAIAQEKSTEHLKRLLAEQGGG